jgi:hypothetical protein
MWQLFSRNLFLLVFLFISLSSFSKNDTSAYNPFFRDSVLKNKIDSGRWNKLVSVTDIHKPSGKAIFVQKQKHAQKSTVLLYISLAIALLLVVLRLIFDDFSFSLLEGMVSVKKFYIFYKSKKYDSLFAILSVYIFKISILSLVVYIGLRYMQQDDFTNFSFYFFFDIWVLLGLFFTVKNVIEFIFNWVIDTQETFKAFFLQNLFAEFVVSVFLLVLFLIYIYNSHISYDFMFGLLLSGLGVYVVFNIVRSYQLMGNVRIPYKLHFFLYICAFKILPVLLLVKYILNNVVQ